MPWNNNKTACFSGSSGDSSGSNTEKSSPDSVKGTADFQSMLLFLFF